MTVAGLIAFSRKFRLLGWIFVLLLGVLVMLNRFYPAARQMFPAPVLRGARQIRALYLQKRYGARTSSPGISAKYWRTSDDWVPPTQSVNVVGSKTLITLGAWWDESYKISALPQDSSGTFLPGLAPQLGGPPVQVQIAYQSNPVAAEHTVKPPPLGIRGDGFFLLLEAEGLASDSPVRAGGYALDWHAAYGPGDPKNISNISVTTDGMAAQPGDLAVAIAVQDSYGADNQMSSPAGWTSLGVANSALDNVCYRACYRIVMSPGPQSIGFSWASTSCFVAAAAIVVLKSDGKAVPSVQLANNKTNPLRSNTGPR